MDSLAAVVDRRSYPLTRRGFQYADDIKTGAISSCEKIRQAVARFERDLYEDDSFPYLFDFERSEDVLEFIEKMPHTKGMWGSKRKLIELEPWQCFQFGNMFGWVDADEKRRFREAYLSVARKNGKSITAAVVGNYMFAADFEFGSEVYCGATTEKQAMEVFIPAKIMAKRTPEFRKQYDIEINAKSMVIESSGCKFEPIVGQPGDGGSPSCAIIDEYHEHATSDQYDTMVSGMLAREQPLAVIITTAGYDISSPCYAKYEEAAAVLSGAVKNDRMFALIYEIDKNLDAYDPNNLILANPNLGISVMETQLREKQELAKTNPRHQNTFLVKHANQWTSAKNAFFSLNRWLELGANGFDLDDYAGMRCTMALDMAQKRDFAAMVLTFCDYSSGKPHYYVKPHLFLPEARIEEDGTGRYNAWRKTGEIIQTDGNEIDFALIEEKAEELYGFFSPEAIYYDPAYAAQLAQNLNEEGLPMVEYQQTPAKIGPPMDELAVAIEAGRLTHDGNGAMAWMIGNVINYREKAKLPAPAKQTKENKIDGAVALIMSIAGLMTYDGGNFDDYISNPVVAG